AEGAKYTITRSQVPLLPAHAFVDYKVQGRLMTRVNIDLRECRSSLARLCILRLFPPQKIYKRIAQEFRDGFERLEQLHTSTMMRWNIRAENTSLQY
ncbi:hypothetical protein B0H13DRAFT_1629425, partial [Mycena leptocephala]